MKKLLLLANPVAGVTGTERYLLEMIDRLVVGGFEVTVETTQHKGHLTEIITERAAHMTSSPFRAETERSTRRSARS